MTKRYTLHIDSEYTPDTIPMEILAKYLQHFAELLGHADSVHFDSIEHGSTQLAVRVDESRAQDVAERLAQLKRGEGDPKANIALEKISKLFATNKAKGHIYENNDHSVKIIDFPVTQGQTSLAYGPFNEEGDLEGILFSVTGADETVHLQLQDGDIKHTKIETNREIASDIAKHMFKFVRVSGTGRWQRNNNGKWEMKKFTVKSFEVLHQSKLTDVIEKMRLAFRDSDLANMADPHEALKLLRDDEESLHP